MQFKVLVDSLDTARFTCPECSREKVMQLSGYRIKPGPNKVKCRCACGYEYIAVLEHQPEPVHHTQLLGTFVADDDKIKCSGKMIVKKLNTRGLMLKTNITHKIPPGTRLVLEFVLDDAKQSIVTKQVMVTAKKDKHLSAKFLSGTHDDNLGPYLALNRV
jgi:hypothetical protein